MGDISVRVLDESGLEGRFDYLREAFHATLPVLDYPREHYHWGHDKDRDIPCSCIRNREIDREPDVVKRKQARFVLLCYYNSDKVIHRILASDALGYGGLRFGLHEFKRSMDKFIEGIKERFYMKLRDY